MKIEELVEENAMDIERVRTEVRKLLERPEGCFNLTLEDLGLASAIRIIAETAEKRIELGEEAGTALRVALDQFEFYLEGAEERRDEPFSFAQWMAETCLPLIRLPAGSVVDNPEAVQITPPVK
jgi:hypothetical protein